MPRFVSQEIRLQARDIRETIAFYTDVLGFTGVVVINVEGVIDLHAATKNKAKVVWGSEVYSYGMREFAVEDPNGYRITFCEPTDDPPTCEV